MRKAPAKRAALPFRQSDISRAIKGVVKAGFGPVWRVEVKPDGTIVVVVGGPQDQNCGAPPPIRNPWDEVV
jgi:hypothetical protein